MSTVVHIINLHTKHGDDIAVFKSRADADAALASYATDNWDDALVAAEWNDEDFPQDSPGGQEAVRLYFDAMSEKEWYEFDEVTVVVASDES